jgi:hypothetical protein
MPDKKQTEQPVKEQPKPEKPDPRPDPIQHPERLQESTNEPTKYASGE